MKNYILGFLLIYFNFSYANDSLATLHRLDELDWKSGTKTCLFGDQVKLREKPNVNSKSLGTFAIGTPLVILNKDVTIMDFQGEKSNWYQVEINGVKGYVLGALISLDFCEYNGIKYFYRVKLGDVSNMMFIRYFEANEKYKELNLKLSGMVFRIFASDGKGLKNVNSILTLDYLAEACMMEGGESYLLYVNQNLSLLADLHRVSDAGVLDFSEHFVFPTDENGLENKIIFIKEKGELRDESFYWFETKTDHIELEWNGQSLMPDLEKFRD